MSTWVDDFLLSGPDEEVCLWIDGPISRIGLRRTVIQRQNLLRDVGVGPVHSVAMQQQAGLDHVATVLAVWRLGAQLITIDHRVTKAGFADVLDLLRPKAVVTAERICQRPVWTPRSEHLLVQVTSGSTGAPKAVGRTFTGIVDEMVKTRRTPGMPARGESMIVLAAFAHTYGLFAGLLHGLHTGARVIVPDHLTARGIANAAGKATGALTIFGVPFHLRVLASLTGGVPGLERVVSSGERLDPLLAEQVGSRLDVPVGQIYGMTETGMIAADLDGRRRPAVGALAPGVQVRVEDGELMVRMDTSPYLNRTCPAGWFGTGDAAAVDPDGLVTLHGRMDAQVVIGGLKVDLSEVERIIAALPGVADAVVVNDGVVKAYVVLRGGAAADTAAVTEELNRVLAPHQRPRVIHTVSALPRTPSGKVVRALDQLEEALP